MPSSKFELIRKCQLCGKEFYAKTTDSVFCSTSCSQKSYKRRKAELKKAQMLDEVVKRIDDKTDFIKVSEAYALFGVCGMTIYRLIKKGTISMVNLGEKQIRVRKSELAKIYPLRRKAGTAPKQLTKLYSLEQKDCYSIGEVTEKFGVCESTVYKNIRQHSIPTRQIGKYVYVPKDEINKLFK